jgi:large subunit ribosomal protein L23
VDRRANKIEIKQAVEKIFKVDVLEVRTSTVKGRMKRVGRHMTKTSDWKKAVVKIKPGQSVEFFEGV